MTERGTIVSTTPANTNPTLARRVEHRPGNSSMQDCLRRTVGRWRSDHHQICPSNPTPARIAPATESCSISAIGKGKLPYILFSSGKTLAVFVWWHRCTIFFGRTYRPLQWYVVSHRFLHHVASSARHRAKQAAPVTLKMISTNTFSPRTTVITGNFSELALECPVSSAAAWRAWACPVPSSSSWPLIEGTRSRT